MSRCRLLALGCGALLAMVVAGSAAAKEGQWVALFDGRTLHGWVQKNGTAEYRVEGGAIVGRTSAGSPNSFLATTRQYGDFELEFEVKVDDPLNSGVQIRSKVKERTTGDGADDQAGRVFGPQIEIEATPGLAGYLYGEATGRGWLTPQQRLKPHRHFRNGQWNRYRVVACGPIIRTWLNHQPIEDLTDRQIYRTHPSGFIGLQVHGIERGAGPYEVAWRNLRLRELPATAANCAPSTRVIRSGDRTGNGGSPAHDLGRLVADHGSSRSSSPKACSEQSRMKARASSKAAVLSRGRSEKERG